MSHPLSDFKGRQSAPQRPSSNVRSACPRVCLCVCVCACDRQWTNTCARTLRKKYSNSKVFSANLAFFYDCGRSEGQRSRYAVRLYLKEHVWLKDQMSKVKVTVTSRRLWRLFPCEHYTSRILWLVTALLKRILIYLVVTNAQPSQVNWWLLIIYVVSYMVTGHSDRLYLTYIIRLFETWHFKFSGLMPWILMFTHRLTEDHGWSKVKGHIDLTHVFGLLNVQHGLQRHTILFTH